jgi:EAL domain-containing protein (putative c-di-GMP-specific phosphodiesterase class I)
VVSFEALARWVHPVRGMINPAIFITIAEQTGMIEAIGAQMLKDSCAAAKKWPDEISVAVNISPIQFKKPESLIKAVKEALRSTKLPARRLHLEITESLLIHDPAQTRKTMEELIEIGVKLSLDDFGTGFSSLSYIMNYPFSKIKIDKAFTDRLSTNDPAPPLIIQAITYIAAGLSFDVVAEGIETQNQEDQIRKLGPTLGQGYLFSKPVSIEKTLEFFESHKQSVQKIA